MNIIITRYADGYEVQTSLPNQGPNGTSEVYTSKLIGLAQMRTLEARAKEMGHEVARIDWLSDTYYADVVNFDFL